MSDKIAGKLAAGGLHDQRHQYLYDYWRNKRAGRLAPTRADIDPVDLKAFLPNMFIFKVTHEPDRRYQCVLLGTLLVTVLERDYTGCDFDEMYQGDAAGILRAQYDHVTDKAEPYYDRLDAVWANKDYIAYERLLLPLSEDGRIVDRLIGCSFFTQRERPSMNYL